MSEPPPRTEAELLTGPPEEPLALAAPLEGQGGGAWTEVGLALMVAIWGLNFTIVKIALDSFEPLAFNALRYLLASAFVFTVLWAQGRLRVPERRDVPRILVLGLVGNLGYQMAFILGLDRTRAGNAALMLALVPVFVLLAEGRQKRHGNRAWLGAGLSVAGVALVSGSAVEIEGTTTLVGDLILIGAAAFWALYTNGAAPLIERYGSISVTAWTLWVGGLGLVLAGIPSLLAQRWEAVGPGAWAGLVYSAILSIGLAYLLWYRGVEKLGGTHTAVFANLTPVIALIAGAVWLGERLTLLSVVGAALVIGGVMLVRSR